MTLKINQFRNIQRWGLTQAPALVFALSAVGYPIAGFLSFSLDLPSTDTSIPFRSILLTLSIITFVLYLPRSELRAPVLLILAFWVAYLGRLMHDTFGEGLLGADYALTFYLAATLAPSLALMVTASRLHDNAVAIWVHILGGIVCVWALLIEAGGVSIDRNLTALTGRLSVDTVNPVTLGHVAVTAIIAGYYLQSRVPQLRIRILIAINSLICFVCLLETGSKAPLIALAITVAFLIVARVGFWRMFLSKTSIFVFLGAIILLMYAELFSEVPLYLRIAEVGADLSTIDRANAIADALDQAWQNPWLGSAFMELNSGEYPHNLVVEAFMALGIPAGILFLGIVAFGTRKAFFLSSSHRTFTALMFIQYLVAGMFSGSLYGSVIFWAALVLLYNSRVNEDGLSTQLMSETRGTDRPMLLNRVPR